jgi:hypothetical protein
LNLIINFNIIIQLNINMINYQELYDILDNNIIKEDQEMNKLLKIIDYNSIYMDEKEFNNILYLISTNNKKNIINYIKYIKLIKSMHNIEF